MNPASKQRRVLVSFGAVVCLIYSLHITLRTLFQAARHCPGGTIVKQSYETRLTYSAIVNASKLTNFAGFDKNPTYKRQPLAEDIRTDYFNCIDFDKLPQTEQAIAENTKGNRGISFMKVKIDDVIIATVYKEASRVLRTFADEYKYNTAKREIEFLTKLRGLPGIPRLFGSCVTENRVGYIVERITGYTFCNDNGTTANCSSGRFLLESVAASPDPPLAALRLAYTTTRLFKLLEERHLFFEDISGVNLMFSPDFEIFLVDADSLVFYNDSRLFSKLLCTSHEHCPGPSGNLWVAESLNARIYKTCKDFYGICEYGRCRGFDVSLHACGMSEWYLCHLGKFFENTSPHIKDKYESMCKCLRQPFPQFRCTFETATGILHALLEEYINEKTHIGIR
ncbi:uncharacterized protein LOC143461669 [Clavelina lepadiformis]|uniref:uncharacterized protein LOC143461669 n=1 Tax=Clavelina lepadiformis TaxID=159417 RepID=UPI0040433547